MAQLNSPSPCHSSPRKLSKVDLGSLTPIQKKELQASVERQIGDTISKAVRLHKRQAILEKLILIESVLFMFLNSFSSIVGTSHTLDPDAKDVILYTSLTLGFCAGSISIAIKWMNNKQEVEIEGYRTVLRDICERYEQEAVYVIERRRLSLPSEVLKMGLFRNLSQTFAGGNLQHLKSIVP